MRYVAYDSTRKNYYTHTEECMPKKKFPVPNVIWNSNLGLDWQDMIGSSIRKTSNGFPVKNVIIEAREV